MTANEADKKEIADRYLKEYPLKWFVLGYVWDANGEKEYISVACVSWEQVERNRMKMINSIVWELVKTNL